MSKNLSDLDWQKWTQGIILFLTTTTLFGVGQIIFDLYSSEGKLANKVNAPITECPEPCKDIVEKMKKNQCGDECRRRVRRIDERLQRIQDLLIENQMESEHGSFLPSEHYSYPPHSGEPSFLATFWDRRPEDSRTRRLGLYFNYDFEIDEQPKFRRPIESEVN